LTETCASAESVCGGCRLCAEACPAGAIRGVEWSPGLEREALFDAKACNDYMRAHFMHIGRGAVCGICIKVCPKPGRKAALSG
ncbi:MAG: 4Fe-4S dicluster domain-containing protein, partial [Clostridiales bacterium]|nr:4Fe-4S dicluster domain-containing protein [Clostridiales bacterium]